MSRFVTYNSVKIHFTSEGEGEAIVLLHGFLENMSMWNSIKPHLLKTHCVICIDLPGHGKSECYNDVHTMEFMAETVNSILIHEGIGEAILIGHSMGGYVSLAFAELYPEKVKALCLANSTFNVDSVEKKINRDRAVEAVKQNYKTFVRIAIPSLFDQSKLNKHQNEIRALVSDALKMKTQSIISAIKGMKLRPDRSNLFANGKFKKMLILGKNDSILNIKELIKQTKKSDVEIIILEGGHMSYIEDVEDFTYNILHFIENL